MPSSCSGSGVSSSASWMPLFTGIRRLFFFQAEDGIRDKLVTGVQTCALPISLADDDRAWVEDHSRGCASCRDRLALIAALSQAVRESVVACARGLDLKRLPDRRSEERRVGEEV